MEETIGPTEEQVPIEKLSIETDNLVEATSGDVFKFENAGDFIQGIFLGYEESKTYPGSYSVKVSQENQKIKVVFVSGIVIDKIKANQIEPGDTIKIDYLGKRKTQDGKKDYNDYKVFFRKQ